MEIVLFCILVVCIWQIVYKLVNNSDRKPAQKPQECIYVIKRQEPTCVADAKERLLICDALKAKNYDPEIAEILCLAKAGEIARISSIQRKFEMGYAKASSLMDQMESLVFVSLFQNGKREWMIDADDTETILKLIEVADLRAL